MKFVAVDGEGITLETGEHRYILLASSTGRTRFRANGLSTRACIEFLFELKAENPRSVLVGFGFNYDVNMMLSDFPRDILEDLWRDGRVSVKMAGASYSIEWIPSKYFSIKREGRKQVKVYDVWAFFQSSFLRSIQKWNIGSERERRLIEERKNERAVFSLDQVSEIKRYCLLECQMLVGLCERLYRSLDAANIVPKDWYGPGAIAARVLRSQGVKRHHKPDADWPPKIQDAIRRSYFGGRVEMFQQGEFPEAVAYDIRSAYPRAILNLPALDGGRWRDAPDFEPGTFGVWAVGWALPDDRPLTPFPHRTKERQIYYPRNGLGCYHTIEVQTALQIFGDSLTIMGGFVFEPATNKKPFAFVNEFYELRRELKEREDAAEYAYKLALNSLYGKLAQGLGFGGNQPPFQSYLWAGYITAWTRAAILRIMGRAENDVIFCATDGVCFLPGGIDLPTSDKLGGLERTNWRDLFVAQNGIYHGFTEKGDEVNRSRGFFVKDLDFPAIREIWRRDGPYGHFRHDSTRFVGIGAALMRTDFDGHWRRWISIPRDLSLCSDRKWYADNGNNGNRRLLPPTLPNPGMSLPYEPKRGSLDHGHEIEDWIAGLEQPMVSDG